MTVKDLFVICRTEVDLDVAVWELKGLAGRHLDLLRLYSRSDGDSLVVEVKKVWKLSKGLNGVTKVRLL